jgi:hypothetical protein
MNQYQTAFANTTEQWLVDAENGLLDQYRAKAKGSRLSPINWYLRYWMDRMLYEGSAGGEVDINWNTAPVDIGPAMNATQPTEGGDINFYVDVDDLYPSEDWGYGISVKYWDDSGIYYYFCDPGGHLFTIPDAPETSELVVYWCTLRKGWLRSERTETLVSTFAPP